MYLLDTNHCSYIINNNSIVADALRSRFTSEIGISIITYGELLYMAEKLERKAQNFVAVQAFLANVDLYFIDEETAILYSQLKTAVFNQFAPKDKSKRRSTSAGDLGFDDHDLWIAATAIQHNLVVVSADSDFIRIQQAQPFSLESWL
ncbi:type II toxin-antitoxin system VapC family toxin [Leptolyngbya sp. FACHB-671]|uniref:type II toxin-antitoxin system VapC family toxin n=1 Tax=Leptolyngbya sp. FACHB-671 TaxID=2692812 RepID=UPI0016849D57|nr:type II toxin-antitoxin system VapC family toxin [Leptolyngbya sp. FACHB-671]MBD2070741.1 type II toxin-antitoxin system VapC family toxin [Leptolyngbya sp. FACHB-671]